MKKLQINRTDIRIRPSSIDNFSSCSYQWARVFLGGEMSIPNARATIGTAIHAGVEVTWNAAIKSKKKDLNLTMAKDAAIQELHDKIKEESPRFDIGEDTNTAEKEVVGGITAYLGDIMPFTPIPLAVEEFFKVDLDHPLVKDVGGTVDYLSKHVIGDVKTSKRKITPNAHTVQQSVYTYLARENGYDIKYNNIQGVVLGKSKVYGETLKLDSNVPQAKYLINSLLDVLEVASQDVVPLESLFRGNTKYYLCSEKYCAFHSTCPFVNGTDTHKKKAKPSL